MRRSGAALFAGRAPPTIAVLASCAVIHISADRDASTCRPVLFGDVLGPALPVGESRGDALVLSAQRLEGSVPPEFLEARRRDVDWDPRPASRLGSARNVRAWRARWGLLSAIPALGPRPRPKHRPGRVFANGRGHGNGVRSGAERYRRRRDFGHQSDAQRLPME